MAEVDIANRALQMLGARSITSLTENSVNARACKACYSVLRDAELEAHPWRFAIKRFALAADGTVPDWGKANSYTLPADYLRLLHTYPEFQTNDLDWEIEGLQIFTNDKAPLEGRYVARIIDTTLMPALFKETLSARMAEEMAEELTQSNAKIANAQAVREKKLAEARRTNAIISNPQTPPDDEWLTKRA